MKEAVDGAIKVKKEYEKARKTYLSLLKKQDTLLRGIHTCISTGEREREREREHDSGQQCVCMCVSVCANISIYNLVMHYFVC